MNIDELLLIARETIDKMQFCYAITMTERGVPNARVVQPGTLKDDWTVRFMSSRRCRKIKEIEQFGILVLGYQYDPEAAYVTLHGQPSIIDDLEAKRAVWRDDTYRWYPDGPEDPNVVIVELSTERIELWSSARGVMPEPIGLSAALLELDGSTWQYSST